MRSVLIAAAAVLALVLATPAGALRRRRPLPRGPAVGRRHRRGVVGLQRQQRPRRRRERSRVSGLRVFADYNGDGVARTARRWSRSSTTARTGCRSTRASSRWATSGEHRVRVAAVQRDQPGLRDQVPAPAHGCWQVVRVTAERPCATSTSPRGRLADHGHDLGRQERQRRPRGGRGRCAVPARIPRRRPRRRARSRRARVLQDQYRPATTRCRSRRATRRPAATCRQSCSSARGRGLHGAGDCAMRGCGPGPA